jgi:hypothetical protein
MSTATVNFEMMKYWPLIKVDSKNHTVYGLVTCEKVDKDGEVCDYAGAKKAYQEWSEEAQESTSASGQDISLGNIRYMHTSRIVAGKATKLKYDDTKKQIWLESVPAPPLSKDDTDVWPLLEGGFLRGYSQGGRYATKVCDECRKDITGNFCNHCNKKVVVRYVPTISEVSYVDNPCLKEARFILVKSDGSTELKDFVKAAEVPTGNAGAIPDKPTEVSDVDPKDKSLAEQGASMACVCKCANCTKGDCANCSAETKCEMSAKAVNAADTPLNRALLKYLGGNLERFF